jgi:hypothetical protein
MPLADRSAPATSGDGTATSARFEGRFPYVSLAPIAKDGMAQGLEKLENILTVNGSRGGALIVEDFIGFGVTRSLVDASRGFLYGDDKPNWIALQERLIREACSILTDCVSAGIAALGIGAVADHLIFKGVSQSNKWHSFPTLWTFQHAVDQQVPTQAAFYERIADGIVDGFQQAKALAPDASVETLKRQVRARLNPEQLDRLKSNMKEAGANGQEKDVLLQYCRDLIRDASGQEPKDFTLHVLGKARGQLEREAEAFHAAEYLEDLMKFEASISEKLAQTSSHWGQVADNVLEKTFLAKNAKMPTLLLSFALTAVVPFINQWMTRRMWHIKDYPGELGLGGKPLPNLQPPMGLSGLHFGAAPMMPSSMLSNPAPLSASRLPDLASQGFGFSNLSGPSTGAAVPGALSQRALSQSAVVWNMPSAATGVSFSTLGPTQSLLSPVGTSQPLLSPSLASASPLGAAPRWPAAISTGATANAMPASWAMPLHASSPLPAMEGTWLPNVHPLAANAPVNSIHLTHPPLTPLAETSAASAAEPGASEAGWITRELPPGGAMDAEPEDPFSLNFPYLSRLVHRHEVGKLARVGILAGLPLIPALGLFDTVEYKLHLPGPLNRLANGLSKSLSGTEISKAFTRKSFQRMYDFTKAAPFTTQQQMASFFGLLIVSRLLNARSGNEFRERTMDSYLGWGFWILGTPLYKKAFALMSDNGWFGAKTDLLKNRQLLETGSFFQRAGHFLQKVAIRSEDEIKLFVEKDLQKSTASMATKIGVGSFLLNVLMLGITEPLIAALWTQKSGRSEGAPQPNVT